MIKVEKFDSSNFEQLKKWIPNEETLIQFAGSIFSYPLTTQQLEEYINRPESRPFRIINIQNNKLIGHAELSETVNENVLKVCRVLIGEKSERGKGLGKLILNKLLEISFENPKIEIVELNVFDWNIEAVKCYEKVGFITNPEIFSESVVNGKKWKAINMTIRKENWKKPMPNTG